MSKELEALKRIENKTISITFGKDVVYYRYGDYLSKEDLALIEKSLKALDIIKSKEMLSVFKDINGKYFIVFNTTAIEIPKEEYELLKEVLI